MKFRTAATLAVFLAVSMLPAKPALAQRGGGRAEVGGSFATRSEAPAFMGRSTPGTAISSPQNRPSSPIMPMSNPVAPFVDYLNNPRPTVQGLPPRVSTPDRRLFDGRFDGRVDVPAVILGGSYWPYYDPLLYPPLTVPPPIPGQLPGVYPIDPAAVEQLLPPPPAPAAPAPQPETTTFFPEPNVIISLDTAKVEPPALGTPRVDVVNKYGDPWGSVWFRGKETLYFRGGLQVVFVDGRVSETQIKQQ